MARLKKTITEALAAGELEQVAQLALENKKTLALLISLSFDKSKLVCWRAIEAMGVATAQVFDAKGPTPVRNIVRRIIWSAREESGGMGWSAPELLGEIVRGNPRAFTDIPPIILSLHEEDEEGGFLRGVLWSLGRMAEAGVNGIEGSRELVLANLDAESAQLRGLAAWTAGRMRLSAAAPKLEELRGDGDSLQLYEDGELEETSVGMLAAESLELVGATRDVKT